MSVLAHVPFQTIDPFLFDEKIKPSHWDKHNVRMSYTQGIWLKNFN